MRGGRSTVCRRPCASPRYERRVQIHGRAANHSALGRLIPKQREGPGYSLWRTPDKRSLLRAAFECNASTCAARQPGDSARFWLRLPESVVQNPGALASQLASPQSAVLETAYQKAGHAAPLVCELDNFRLKVKLCFVFPAVEWANCADSQLQSAALDVSYKIV
ncbi:Hypothetical_protein [Hexamita inflata]|uniref:Hypothetical_protein n=1 Tax=Hexamita inflata TaxID=28002 RepID=A0AA86TPY9_9EUKA|nr:Hypothetical protein HINF_LOCUS12869 [Hexamita inflata]